MPDQFERVAFGGSGELITRRQRQALVAAEKKIRRRYWGFRFLCPQGSWQPRTDYSGTSHTGAAVADLQYWNIASRTRAGKKKYIYVLRCLRDVGQAAFGRGPWNSMVYHYHVCDLDSRFAADTVQEFQVPEYRHGNDGLTSGKNDPFPYRPKPLKKWDYKS